jgi:sulfate transport system ATP-binding protein
MSILLENLTKRYERHSVVSRVGLTIGDGEFFVMLGPSGSGKSTILRMIAGLTEVDEGRVVLHGRDVTALTPQARDIGFVFQHYALFQHMTVGDNIEFALRIRKVGAAERRKRRDELLGLVGLAGLAGRMPRQLSGGQQQRVALARALAHRPGVLLLDEPFGALDAKIRTDLRRTLRAIQRELAITTIFVTHDQEEGFELADRMGVMNMGRLLEVGTPEELYQRPQTEFVATFLGTANVLVGKCVDNTVQVGELKFPLGTTAHTTRPRSSVQVLFRPEDVALVRSKADDGVLPALGRGTVESTVFVGATERLRLRLPALPGVRALAPARRFGDDAFLVDVTRSPDEARRFPLGPGDSAWVAVRRVHALAHPGLNVLIMTDGSPLGRVALDAGGQLARQAHARTTVVTYGRQPQGAAEQGIREAIGSGLPSLQVRAIESDLADALLRTVEQEPSDLAVVGVDARSGVETASAMLSAGSQHVLLVPNGPINIRKALICVTDSEPGKADVTFAARLLRHFGASATLLSVVWVEDHDPASYARIEQFLEAGVRTLQQLDVPAMALVQSGDVDATIAAELAEGDYDLLILGAPLPGRDGRVHLTGVVQRLLAAGLTRPVLIVRSTYVYAPGRLAPVSPLVEEIAA